MSLLADLKLIIDSFGIPIETGVFKDKAPDKYIVLVPIGDELVLNADDKPQAEIQNVRITFYSKSNYVSDKNKIIKKLISDYYCVSDSRYGGFDTSTGYHQYHIDVEKEYLLED